MNEPIEKGMVLIGRIFGLWFVLSLGISLIPLILFSLSMDVETTDTDQVLEGFTLIAEWMKWFVTSQVQLSSIIGTIFINLAYEIKKSNRPRW